MPAFNFQPLTANLQEEHMRRWNGWGDEATTYHLPESAGHFLEAQVGKGSSIPDVTFDRAVVAVPHSRLNDRSQSFESLDRSRPDQPTCHI
jgi:hypothetical protein